MSDFLYNKTETDKSTSIFYSENDSNEKITFNDFKNIVIIKA